MPTEETTETRLLQLCTTVFPNFAWRVSNTIAGGEYRHSEGVSLQLTLGRQIGGQWHGELHFNVCGPANNLLRASYQHEDVEKVLRRFRAYLQSIHTGLEGGIA